MKERKKVLYISQEIAPYLPDSPLALAGRNLAQGSHDNGYEVRTFMPKYGSINERRNQLHEVIRLSGMNISIDDSDHPLIIKVATLQPARMQVYFIDNDDYFHFSPDKTLEIDSSPEENDERIMFFAKGAIETVKKLRWDPAIIHCMGWTTALIPLYLRSMYADEPTFAKSKVIYALRSEGFEGNLDSRFDEKLALALLPPDVIQSLPPQVDFNTLNKLAIDNSDAIVVSSPDVNPDLIEYAIQTGKPLLNYVEDDKVVDSYAQFFETLINQ